MCYRISFAVTSFSINNVTKKLVTRQTAERKCTAGLSMYHRESAAWTTTIMSKYCRISWSMSIKDSNCGVPEVLRQPTSQLRVTYTGLRLIDLAATVYAAQSWSSSNSELSWVGKSLEPDFGFLSCVCFEFWKKLTDGRTADKWQRMSGRWTLDDWIDLNLILCSERETHERSKALRVVLTQNMIGEELPWNWKSQVCPSLKETGLPIWCIATNQERA
jgi:hypothetical protein